MRLQTLEDDKIAIKVLLVFAYSSLVSTFHFKAGFKSLTLCELTDIPKADNPRAIAPTRLSRGRICVCISSTTVMTGGRYLNTKDWIRYQGSLDSMSELPRHARVCPCILEGDGQKPLVGRNDKASTKPLVHRSIHAWVL
jgi:hypothetical protein